MSNTAKTTTKTPLPEPRIFKIVVREDAHEVGMVVAYPVDGKPEEATVKAQTKKFPSEESKLKFLMSAKDQGFRNFETTQGNIDTEGMILSELARRQSLEKRPLTVA